MRRLLLLLLLLLLLCEKECIALPTLPIPMLPCQPA